MWHRILLPLGWLVLGLGPPQRHVDVSSIQIQLPREDRPAFEVRGVPPEILSALVRANLTTEQWQDFFRVRVESAERLEARGTPPLLGSYEVSNSTVRFLPRFPAQAGVHYLVVCEPAVLPKLAGVAADGFGGSRQLVKDFYIPRSATRGTRRVEAVYPSRDVLPENLLKFYIQFSAAMSRGEAYANIHLLDGSGKEVDLPFLELDEELWDAGQRRFTLFFDPGRIKRGVRPREEIGPALLEGRRYRLVVDRQWRDADGVPLGESFEKPFLVGPADDRQPDPGGWAVTAPAAAGRGALVVRFPESLDHAMLQRVIHVRDAAGKEVYGAVEIRAEETEWRFTPRSPWRTGTHTLVIQSSLEDLAGNSIGRPFEVDEFHPVQRRVQEELVKLEFRVQ